MCALKKHLATDYQKQSIQSTETHETVRRSLFESVATKSTELHEALLKAVRNDSAKSEIALTELRHDLEDQIQTPRSKCEVATLNLVSTDLEDIQDAVDNFHKILDKEGFFTCQERLLRIERQLFLPHNKVFNSKVSSDLPVVYTNEFVSFLRGLDFRLPDGMKFFKDCQIRVESHMLFSLFEKRHYFIRLADAFLHEPFRKDRLSSCGEHNDWYENSKRFYHEQAYRDQACELIYAEANNSGCDLGHLPRYVVWLREVYYDDEEEVNDQGAGRTGYHLVMDIGQRAKSLWLVFCYDVKTLGRQYRTMSLDYSWRHFAEILDNEPFDVAMVAQSVDDWELDGEPFREEPKLSPVHVRHCMKKSSRLVRPVFTAPVLGPLFKSLETGWSDISDPNDGGEPFATPSDNSSSDSIEDGIGLEISDLTNDRGTYTSSVSSQSSKPSGDVIQLIAAEEAYPPKEH